MSPYNDVPDPIVLDPTLSAKLIVAFFRGAADQARNGSLKDGFMAACGEQLIAAHRAWLIPESLSELWGMIEWHMLPNPPLPDPLPKGYVRIPRHPANLFAEVIGGNVSTAKWDGNGYRQVCDERGEPVVRGGLMIRIDPLHLKKSKCEQIAATCEFLAHVIEFAAATEEGNPNAPKRVRCDPANYAIYLDDESLAVRLTRDQFTFVVGIVEAHPDPITFKKIMKGDTKGKNPTRIRNTLPPPLREIVYGNTAGYYLELPSPKKCQT